MKRIKIEVPFKTPSVNHLFGQFGYRKFLTKEAKELRAEISQICQDFKEDAVFFTDKTLKVVTEVYENWLTKKGTIRRKDVMNREKFFTDSVFGALDIDDKMIVDYRTKKIQSEEEKTIITIEVEEGWMI